MKSILLLAVILAFAPSAFASSLMETITCTNADQSLTVLISTHNRPDFDLSKYNSSDDAANQGISLQMASKDGRAVVGNVVTYAFIEGAATNLTSVGSDGKPCSYGTITRGSQVAAKISLNGQRDKLEILKCDDELDGPHGGECNWN